MALTLALKLTADSSDLVGAVKASAGEIEKLGRAAEAAAVDARATAAGLGRIEAQAREAAGAAQGTSAALSALKLNAQGINAALNVANDFDGGARAADIAAFGDELDRVRASINPFVAAQQQFRARQAEINEGLRTGSIFEIEAARAHDLNTAAYRRQLTVLRATTAATRSHTGATRLQGFQVANLFQQLQDVGVQLSTGTNPFIILAQQGPQITSAMGGVRNSLALVRPFFTATTVSVGLVTAALSVGAAAWSSYLTSTKAVEAAAAGLGRGLGATAGDLDEIAEAAAAAGGISVKMAREAEVAFLNTGKIGAEVIGGLVEITRDFAATTGQDFSTAADELARLFADPTKGAAELDGQLAFLDGTTRALIRTLGEQNRVEEQQKVLFDALGPRLADHRQSLTAIGRAWEDVGKKASDAFQRLGEGVDRLFTVRPASERFLAELLQARERARAAFSGKAILEGVGIVDEAEFDREIARVREGLAQAAREATARTANVAATRGDETARRLTPGLVDLEALRKNRADLRAVIDNPVAGAVSEDLDRLAAAYGAARRAVETFIPPAERARRQDELDLAALTAKTAAQKGQIAEEKKRLDLAGQAIAPAEAAAQIERAGALARAQATQALTDEAAALDLNTSSTLAVAAATLQSAEAAELATARREALNAVLDAGGDAEARTRANLAAQVAAEAEQGARAVIEIGAEADAREALNRAVADGSLTLEEANNKAALDATLRPLIIARDNAEGEAKALLTRIIDELTAAQGRLDAARANGAAAEELLRQQQTLDGLRLEISLIGANASERARRLATLSAEQQLGIRVGDILTDEQRRIVENARAEADLNLELDRQRGLHDDIARIGGGALDALADKVGENALAWRDLADVALDALGQIQRQLSQLLFSNPAQNFLFGSNLPTISDAGGLFGGLLAGVFHEGGRVGAGSRERRFVPAAAIQAAPRFHVGGLVSGERVIVAQDDEEVLTARDPRHIDNLRAAASGGAGLVGGGGGGGGGNVIVNNFPAPNTRTEVRRARAANGDTVIDLITTEIKRSIAGDIASGQGDIVGALSGRFGLDPATGLQR